MRPAVDLPDLGSWQQRVEILGAAEDWELRGRIAVKAGEEGFNGKFNWSQTGDQFRATVSGPLGIGTVKITGDNQRVIFTDKDGIETELRDPEADLYHQIGWSIPIASFRFWTLGIPDPNRDAETVVDEAGRLASLTQGDWLLEISRYRESAGQEMPRILTATDSSSRVRMVIDEWLFFAR